MDTNNEPTTPMNTPANEPTTRMNTTTTKRNRVFVSLLRPADREDLRIIQIIFARPGEHPDLTPKDVALICSALKWDARIVRSSMLGTKVEVGPDVHNHQPWALFHGTGPDWD